MGAVRTWYGDLGKATADPLVLLHPGGVDSRVFGPNLEALGEHFHVYTPERRGHGHTPDVEGPYSFEELAGDTIAFLETVVGGQARLLGCSDGAIVGLLVAARRPDLVDRLVMAAGVHHWEGWAPGVLDAGAEAPDFMAKMHGEVSPDGREHFKVVARKLYETHLVEPTLTAEDLGLVEPRTLVMVGDDDEVLLEHATATYRGLPAGELAVLPGTSHGLLVEKPALCNAIILDFLTRDAVETFAPIQRASAD